MKLYSMLQALAPRPGLRRPRLTVEQFEDRSVPATNPIVAENLLPGTPESVWEVSNGGDTSIQGFSTDISVNHGQTISFKVNSSNRAFHIDIYRLGYYQGNGARLVTSITQTVVQNQPAPLTNTATGLVDAGNWKVSASWAVPQAAVSGLYIARLVRNDTGGASLIYFVVRDDSSTSDLLFQTSDTTWQAYNTWGGYSLYQYTGSPASDTAGSSSDAGRAVAVSYNRPLTIDSTTGGYGDYNSPLHGEYPMIRWLEANGYDVSYSTDVDTDRNGSELLQHKVFMSVGHDEYWSGGQRANVEAARDAGVNLAFFSGNESFWKTRWENSVDGSGTSYRTLVCYKESKDGVKSDPLDISQNVWTGTWRDNRFSPPDDGGRPENAMSGVMYMDDRTSNDLGVPLQVPAADASLRFWRNTSVANLTGGQVATLGQYIVGYEVDEDVDNGFRPAGLIDMSSTTFSTTNHVLVPWGTVEGPGTGQHSITLYRAASGALVFGAGTIQWSWGLDGHHNDVSSAPILAIEQATVNLFADMHVQAGSLQAGLVQTTASTDTVPPSVTITAPANGSQLTIGTAVTITGTAADAGGGVVAGVEVSTDGGQTWHPATGRGSWSYTWTPGASGTATILARATDDSANLGAASAPVSVTVTGNGTIFGNAVPSVPSDPDANAVEVGLKFQPTQPGTITAIRFYKGSGNTGTHVGRLWDAAGNLLATVTFAGETSSGWQQAALSAPVALAAGQTYVVSYYAPNGHYASTGSYFNTAYTVGSLVVPASGTVGGNGVYRYGSGGVFPTQTYNASNYWVDVVFQAGSSTDTTPPTVTARSPAAGATQVQPGASVTATFSEPIQSASLVFQLKDASGAAVSATVTYDAGTLTATLKPAANLAANATYTASLSGAQDTAGNVMAPVTWSFTTGTASTTASFWTDQTVPSVPSDPDANAVEVGLKFQPTQPGTITAIRFYKGSGNTGTHVGRLWDAAGNLLATVTFAGETSSGWQQAALSAPVALAAGQTYVVSYYAPNGHYASTGNYFNTAYTSGPLVAPAGGNGVYRYGSGGVFPTQTYNASNYWVDVVFQLTAADTTPPTAPTGLTANASPGAVALNWPAATDNVGVDHYNVYRSTTSGFTPGTGTLVGQSGTTSYTDAGLATGTYYYRVIAVDAAGNLGGPSPEASATVAADTTPPSVAITSPAGGSTVSGTVTATATASDNAGVVGVQFLLDGVKLGSEDTSAPYSVSWNTAAATNGSHTLSAVARDAAGNTATTSVTVIVNNVAVAGLVAAWGFDEGAGTTVADSSGHNLTGTISNATWSTAGKFGDALSFNGTNSWVTVADNTLLHLTGAMTLEAWVFPTAASTDWTTIVLKERGSTGLSYALYGSDGAGRPPAGYINRTNDVAAVGTSVLPLNTWTHLAVTYDGAAIRLYVNGVQVASRSQTGNITTSTSALRIGGNAVWGEYFAGLIDEVRIYSVALTPAQIQADMNKPV